MSAAASGLSKIVLEGPRLILRSMREADATETYAGWLNDPAINQYLESRFTKHTPKSVCAYIAQVNADPASQFFAIERRSDGAHIGNIKLGGIDAFHESGDIGLIIGDRDSWGQGYATEAITLLTRYAFEKLGLEMVWAGAYGQNVGSIRAFEKAGYQVVGQVPNRFRSDTAPGGRDDWVLMALPRAGRP